MTGPASKRIDDKLFASLSPPLKLLAKLGREGLRLKARAAYWAKRQAYEQAANEQAANVQQP